MKEIIKVLLEKEIEEDVIHEVLYILEASDKFKAEKIKNTVKNVEDYKKAIDDVEKDHPNFSKEKISMLRDDQAKVEHNVNSRISKVLNQEERARKRKKK